MISILLLSVLATAPTLQEREVAQTSALEAEIAAALEVAGRKHQRVLVHWGDPASERCQELDSLLRENRDLARKLLYEYRVVRVPTVEDEAVKTLAMKYGAVLIADTPHLTVLDAEGKPLANVDSGTLLEADKFDVAKVQAFLEKHQAPVKDAKELLDAAQTKAGAQQKRVFLTFEAPECVACRKLDARLTTADIRPLMEKDFVFVAVDLERSRGAKELMEKLHGPKPGGTPWFAVLDATGTPIVDSDDVTGSNLGCPQTEAELEAWAATLKRARQHMSDEEVEQVVAAFRKAAEGGKPGDPGKKEKEKVPPRS
jgi:thioredoxin-related protein